MKFIVSSISVKYLFCRQDLENSVWIYRREVRSRPRKNNGWPEYETSVQVVQEEESISS